MKNIKLLFLASLLVFTFVSCQNESLDTNEDVEFNAVTNELKVAKSFTDDVWVQEDQVARPAINTVFTPSERKNEFNTTIPSLQEAAFQADFEARLLDLNPDYTTNLLTLDAKTFTTVLATDVLGVSLVAPTTFFDGTNVLTGRNLSDDVIDVELILIFGGPDGSLNPGLTSDNVDANDKEFLKSFPYLAAPHLN